MATVTLNGNSFNTIGELPEINSAAPNFTLVKNDLSETALKDFEGKTVVLNIFPSLDTPVCAVSVRTFNQKAANLKNTIVLCISKDLPFAQARFCGAEGIENVITLSDFRTGEFGRTYGVTISNGPLAELFARAVVVIKEGKIMYKELVKEISQEPNYDKALKAIV